MRTLHAQSVGIPKDVSVVGFDDIPAATLFWPGLTTVRQQMRAMGAAACRTLLTALIGRTTRALLARVPDGPDRSAEHWPCGESARSRHESVVSTP